MACYPHRENPRRRALNALYEQAGTAKITGRRGGLRIGTEERLTTRAVLRDLVAAGYAIIDGIDQDPPPLAATITPAGRRAVDEHAEAHRLADEKARAASIAGAGAQAASDAADFSTPIGRGMTPAGPAPAGVDMSRPGDHGLITR